MGVNDGTVCLMAGQKKLEDVHKDLDVLPKIKKSVKSHCGVVWAPMAYIIWKALTVQTYGDYPKHTWRLHLLSEKKKNLHETNTKIV